MTAPSPLLVHPPGRIDGQEDPRSEAGCQTEWLDTNALGGFAAGTVTMTPTRRYHGLLVTPPPGTTERHLFLAGFQEAAAHVDGSTALSTLRHQGEPEAPWPESLRSFQLAPWARAVHELGSLSLCREVLCVKGHATVLVRYSLLDVDGMAVVLTLRPRLAFRAADKLTFENPVLRQEADEISGGIRCRPYDALPAMALTLSGGRWTYRAEPQWVKRVQYDTDLARGYEGHEDLFVPGSFEIRLEPGAGVTLAATIEEAVADPGAAWTAEAERRLGDMPAADDLRSRCAVAADHFLYEGPHGRRGILAGFPWFGEWGRDTFIALPGLTLARGRIDDCEAILRGARAFLADGLLPNIYGAGKADSHYGSVDAALWFARAVLLYERAGGDASRVRDEFAPALREIADAYASGSAPGVASLGIAADDSGLIRAGRADLNPTWMDAQTSGGPVTPRSGCPVEIAALWYSLLAHLAELADGPAEEKRRIAARRHAARSFRERFWLATEGYLADVWRPEAVDASVRPNMVLAVSLELSPLRKAERAAVVARAEAELLTPVGLRTLSPADERYAPRYGGGPEQRDGAYHQGTVWPWLLGFFCEASLRVDRTAKNRRRLRTLWQDLAGELDRGGLNHLSEVYAGDPPHERGGTFAQAWNTAECLRALALLDGALPLYKVRRR